MKKKLLKVKEGLEYIEFCTHMSCDTFNGKACDDNTKQAYEEQLYLIGYHVKSNIAILDSIISMLDSPELVDKVAKAIYHVARPKGGESIAYKTNITKAKAAIESIRDNINEN